MAVYELGQVHVSVADAAEHRLERGDVLALADRRDDVPVLEGVAVVGGDDDRLAASYVDDARADRVDGSAVRCGDVDAEVEGEDALAVQACQGGRAAEAGSRIPEGAADRVRLVEGLERPVVAAPG